MEKKSILGGSLKFVTAIVLSLGLLSSCNEKQKDYYSTLGMLNISADSSIITSDDGERLLISNPSTLGTSFKNNDRVVAGFTLVDRTLPKGIHYVIDLNTLDKVLFKPVIELTSNIADSIGNNEVGISSVRLIKDFLNLNFAFYGNSKVHYINMIRHPGPIPTDTVHLEIRHNNNGDNMLNTTYAFVSFDLKSLRNTAKDSVVLNIKAKEFNNRTFEKNFTYKY